jgi:uncharacterized damage-inducible protein DinB
MQPFFEDFFDRLQELHVGIERAIDGLPKEALDWAPGSGMNSLCVLAVHVAGSERYWIGDVVAGEPSGRDRDAEFRSTGLDEGTLKKRLAEVLAHSQGVLEKLTLQDLERSCVSPRDGRRFTVAWALAHALEHTAVHLGQMRIMRRLWEQRQAT